MNFLFNSNERTQLIIDAITFKIDPISFDLLCDHFLVFGSEVRMYANASKMDFLEKKNN